MAGFEFNPEEIDSSSLKPNVENKPNDEISAYEAYKQAYRNNQVENDSQLTDYEKDVLKNEKNLSEKNYKNLDLLYNDGGEKSFETASSRELKFFIPQYGVQDFINERSLWQKGVYNITGEPGWFYFKIFFNFHNSNRGLFAGIMDDTIPNTSAIRYLFGIREFYDYDKIMDRILSLCRFTYTLSYINSITPWFFIGLNGIDKLNKVNLGDFSKEKSIDLICNGESVDMRINTLLDMYKYACYDDINCKEIIPENLRKFDMSILIMNVPIKYFQTGMVTSGQDSKMSQVGSNGDTVLNKAIKGINNVTSFLNGSNVKYFDYKGTLNTNNSLENCLSFQMYTLKNCEINTSSFESYLSNSMNNSQFNKIGNATIKINYDRCYKHTFNEWTQMMYGSDGIHYDGNTKPYKESGVLSSMVVKESENDKKIFEKQKERIKAIKNSIYNNFFDKDTEAYKALIDFSEMVIEDSLINTTDPYFLGNIGTNYDQNSYEDMWEKTKDKVNKFFTKPFKF